MSMQDLAPNPDLPAEDQAWLEAQIESELAALPDNDDEEDEEKLEEKENDPIDLEGLQAMPESMVMYMERSKSRTEQLQVELDGIEELMRHNRDQDSMGTGNAHLQAIAEETGEDPITLRNRVLNALEKEEADDKQLKEKLTNEVIATPNTQETCKITLPDVGLDNEEHIDLNGNCNADAKIYSQNDSKDQCQETSENGEPAQENVEPGMNVLAARPNCSEVQPKCEESPDKDVGELLNPAEGVVAIVMESDVLERQKLQQIWQWEKEKEEQNERRKQEDEVRRNEELQKQAEITKKRQQRQLEIDEEQQMLALKKQESDERTKKEAEEFQKRFEESMQKYEAVIHQLAAQTEREQEQFIKAQQEELQKKDKQKQDAALKIQAAFRGYRVYKIHGCTVKNRVLAWKVKVEEDKLKAIEEQRKMKEVEAKKTEEERLKKEEDERKREEEEKLKIEKEKQRKEEEREAAEAKKREQEKRRIEEERRQVELKILEEERKREEERRQVDLKRLKEEQEKEEERRQEELKRKKEEERREEQKKDELKRLEEEKKREEEKRLREEKKMKEEQEQKQLEELIKLEEMKKLEKERKDENQSVGKTREIEIMKEESGTQREQGASTQIKEEQDQGMLEKIKAVSGMAQSGCSLNSTTSSHIYEKENPLSARKSDLGLSLPELVEQRRLAWMKECKPWSKILREQKTKKLSASKRALRRPISAKKVSPLSEEQILTAARVSSLQQVTTVELHDLPGCSIKPLGQCNHLRTLTVINCGLVTLDGLEQCNQLRFADLRENAIESMNLRDLSNLVYLELSHNSLSSISGLEGCINLRMLSLANNRITRISGLETLKGLHTLDLAHNQLITCDGLSEAPSIQRLDVSHNHLSKMGDLNSLALLEVLNIAGNNLMQVPVLANHVLLNQLVLEDNSLTSLRSLSQSWLPLLQALVLTQNSLNSIENLSTCVLLQTLDISHNQILDLEQILPGLTTCLNLTNLNLGGNPVMEEPECRSLIQQKAPTLVSLDGVPLSKNSTSSRSLTCFESMCAMQLKAHNQLRNSYISALQSTVSPEEKYHIHCQYYDQSRKLAEDHRYIHEYGEVSQDSAPKAFADFSRCKQTVDSEKPKTQEIPSSVSSKTKDIAKSKFEQALLDVKPSSTCGDVLSTPRPTNVSASVVGKLLENEGVTDVLGLKYKAAVKIQALWRGYSLRRDIERHTQLFLAHEAATKIQSLWRGFQLRKRMQSALDFARHNAEKEEVDDDFGEVDLTAFDFNEDDLEKGWVPPATPQLPASYPVIGKHAPRPPEGKPPTPTGSPQLFERIPRPPVDPPAHPKHAWRNAESPMSEQMKVHHGKPPLPPLSLVSGTSGSETHRTENTHKTQGSKQEELSEEWGFKDTRTAELMMQRAKKLKYNAQKKKKLSQLDPHQRLALFRKLDQTTNLKPVVPPARRQAAGRKEYFQAREEQQQQKEVERVEENNQRLSRTFEWLHTQVGHYDVADSRINEGLPKGGIYSSDSNLPHMDPGVIAGGRAILTGSPVSIELQSVGSVSTLGDHSNMVRRHSMSDRDSGSSAVQLPPIKTSSAPVNHIKERLSWRGPKVDKSVGWGGGQKRTRRT